jgi:glycosyltransferase involved in cell wall biosynthesis
MIKNRDIIWLNLTPWDYDFGNNACNLAEEMSKHNRVLYINPPLDRITSMRAKYDPKIQKRQEVIKGSRPDVEQHGPNLWVLTPKVRIESINWLPNSTIFDKINRRNNEKLARAIHPVLRQLRFRDYIIVNDNDIFRTLYMKEYLQPEAYYYYIRDQLTAVDYWKRHGIRLEPKHMAKADGIMANSVHLADYGRQFNPNSHYVGQGCDLSAWKEELVDHTPEDLASIQGPIVGYVGALDSNRLDIRLIAHIARARADWSVVLVGPEDDNFLQSELHAIDNVYFLGGKPPESLPSYVKGFDVCINPQEVNPVTIGNYPRKIDEYLAMGKPTVGTMTKAMTAFAEHVYLSDSNDAWVDAIAKALAEDNEHVAQARKEFAASHSWEANVGRMYEVMEKENEKLKIKN